ncbi:hypothetical protein RUM43_006846 [Polyplax serrata]|uniref:CCC domain-containing protein n=1 Tax=Polyplax serrata TaxID=468196 RepID=A0AAN8P4X8_POLSC
MSRLSGKHLIFFAIFSLLVNNVKLQPVDERTNFRTIFDLLLNIGNGLQSESAVEKAYSRLNCPLCDSSVYSYCSEKLLHDACCCLNPYENKLPYQCKYADCSFLHANTCREHKLITACCCSKHHNKDN